MKKRDDAREKGITDEQAKRKIEQLRKRISKGEDFAAIAKENSEDTSAQAGGLVGWVERGSMIPVIDDVIFNLKLNEISDIIETEVGYHLFRVEEKQEGKKLSLEQSREKIYGNLFRQKAEERFNEWMMELKKSSYISIR